MPHPSEWKGAVQRVRDGLVRFPAEILGLLGSLVVFACTRPGVVHGMAFAATGAFVYVFIARLYEATVHGSLRAVLGTERTVWGLRVHPGRLLLDLLLVAVIVVAAGGPLFKALLEGRVPLSHDHSIHAFKAWLTATHNFPRFRLTGWNHYIWAGDPHGDLYHIVGDVLVAAVYRLSFGKLSFVQAYGWTVAMHWVFASVAVYVSGKRFVGRVGAFAAAMFFATDPGAWDHGWYWSVGYGVWPQYLGLGFALLAMGSLHDLLAEPTPWRFAVFSIWTALGVLSHPVVGLYLAPAILLYVPIWSVSEQRSLGRGLLLVGGACALALGLMAFWQLPFSTLAPEWAARAGVEGFHISALATRAIKGEYWEGTHAFINVLGVVGIVVGIVLREPGGLVWALHSLLLVAFSTHEVQLDLHLFDLSEVFRRIWYGRVHGVAKLSWMLAAGYAVQVLFVRSRFGVPSATIGNARRRGAVLVFLGLLFVGPFLVPAARELLRFGATTRAVGDLESFPDAANWRAYLNWSRLELYERDFVRNGFFRVLYHDPTDLHQHMYFTAPLYNHLPTYKWGYTPAVAFKNHNNVVTDEVAQALSIKYVVTTDEPPLSDCVLVRSFGRYHVYRYDRFNPHRVVATGADVTVTRFDDEEIRFTVRNARPGARARVATAFYPRWHAWQDGREIPVRPVRVDPSAPATLIDVPVRNGEVVLRYLPLPVHRVGTAMTVLALLVVALLGLLSLRPGLRERWVARVLQWFQTRFGHRWHTVVTVVERGTVVVFCTVPVAILLRVDPPTGPGALCDFRSVLPEQAVIETPRGIARCRWVTDPLAEPRWDCSPVSNNPWAFRQTVCSPQLSEAPAGSFQANEELSLVGAVFVPTVSHGASRLRYRDVPIGHSLRGVLYIGHRTRLDRITAAEQEVRISIDGVLAGTVRLSPEPVRFAIDTRRWRGRRSTVEFTAVTTDVAPDLCLIAATHE